MYRSPRFGALLLKIPDINEDCRLFGDNRADAGARGDLKRQIPTSTASAHDDALSADKRKLAEVFDDSETVFNGIGGLKIDVAAPIGWRNEDVAGCQKAGAGGEIARGGFETCERHRCDATVKPDDDREGTSTGRLPQHRQSAMAVGRDRRDRLQRTRLLRNDRSSDRGLSVREPWSDECLRLR